jgi:hypothetical protein
MASARRGEAVTAVENEEPTSETAKKKHDAHETEKKEKHYAHVEPRDFGSVDVDTYIGERFNPMIEWYDKKSGWAKTRYLRVQATTVIGGALVPVLVNLNVGENDTALAALKFGTTIISILVVILVALEGVLHYREQWVNYRSTEQFMRREYYLFTAGEGLYAAVDAEDNAQALRRFVERIESALSAESASTLQILTSTSDASASEAKQAGTVAPPPSATTTTTTTNGA